MYIRLWILSAVARVKDVWNFGFGLLSLDYYRLDYDIIDWIMNVERLIMIFQEIGL